MEFFDRSSFSFTDDSKPCPRHQAVFAKWLATADLKPAGEPATKRLGKSKYAGPNRENRCLTRSLATVSQAKGCLSHTNYHTIQGLLL